MKYPKINTLWKREDGKGAIIEGDYSLEEFGNIRHWHVQEKIDGMNIRIQYNTGDANGPQAGCFSCIKKYGRTDEAQIPEHLQKHLDIIFTHDSLKAIFVSGKEDKILNITLFGEGYGPKIQSGGNYRSTVGFILFDIYINEMWLKQDDVLGIAEKLGIPYAPFIGVMTEEEIVDYIKSKPLSHCSETPQIMEGVICRPVQPLLLRNRNPLLFKLKCKDFPST